MMLDVLIAIASVTYVQLIKDDKIISTLDLFEKDYVLLIGAEGYEWQTAANKLMLTLPLKNYRIAHNGDLIDSENVWHELYEITTTGAVLIRPDGHVAWRSKAMVDSPIDTLRLLLQV